MLADFIERHDTPYGRDSSDVVIGLIGAVLCSKKIG